MKEADIPITETTLTVLAKHLPKEKAFEVINNANFDLDDSLVHFLLSKYTS